MLLSIKRCDSFFPLIGYRWLQFFHCVKFSSMVDFLLKGPPNSRVNRIKIGDVWGPHVRLNEINLLFLYIICDITCPTVCARAPSCWNVHLCWWHLALISGNRPFPRTNQKWYELLTFVPGSIKIMFDLPMRDTPAETIPFRQKCFCSRMSRPAGIRPFCNKLYTNVMMT